MPLAPRRGDMVDSNILFLNEFEHLIGNSHFKNIFKNSGE